MHCRRHKRLTRQKLVVALVAASFVRPAPAQLNASSADRHPNFEGIWNSATATPLERPAQLKDQEFFTPEEAANWERRAASRRQDPKPEAAARTFASYNAIFYETGTKLLKSLRTSIITDPPDGKIPALVPAAAAEKRRRLEFLRQPRSATDLGLQDQCIVFPTAVAPMIPYIYNSNYQIIETGHEVMINVEMVHDTRIIQLDRQSHLSPSVRLWLGDSVGHWEGGTLVVDTTNFNDGSGFFGDAGGMFGSDRNLHVVERFSLIDANTMLYRFEVDDSTAFARPWKGELTWIRSAGAIFEYACHEGNYALPDLLNGARALEREKSATKKQ
jgi:hypothetical protein